jgi:hypothetical protein
MYRKILDMGFNPMKPTDEFEAQLLALSKMTGSENRFMTSDELKHCIFTIKKNQDIRKRFQNPYLEKVR